VSTTPATRASTLAKTLDDGFGLRAFDAATTLETVAANKDLLAALTLVRTTPGEGSWRAYKPLHEDAQARRGKPEAQAGTNIHSVVQALVEGTMPLGVDPVLLGDAEAVLARLTEAGLEPVTSEEFVVTTGLPELVAGTRDMLARGRGGRHVVVDIKSTSTLGGEKFRALAWSIQLAVYAHGRAYLGGEPRRDRWERPMIDLAQVADEDPRADLNVAAVVEVERGTGQTALHRVNLVEGWQYARLACQVRAARKAQVLL
jgi:hypothetical protein